MNLVHGNNLIDSELKGIRDKGHSKKKERHENLPYASVEVLSETNNYRFRGGWRVRTQVQVESWKMRFAFTVYSS